MHTDTGSPVLYRQRKDSASSCSPEAGSDASDHPPVDLYVEEGELSDDQDMTVTEPDQALSAEPPPPSFYTGVDSGGPPESALPSQIIPRGRFWEASQNLPHLLS